MPSLRLSLIAAALLAISTLNLQVRFGLIEAAHAVNLHIGTGRVLLGKGNGGSGPPPGACNGKIDLSTGCIHPGIGP